MSQADLETNRCVRRVLVKHWIDLGRLSIRSAASRVYIRGYLDRIYGNNEEITPTLVDTIFTEIKRVKGVKNVNPELENWSNQTGGWKPVGTPGSRTQEQSSSTGGTYNIEET